MIMEPPPGGSMHPFCERNVRLHMLFNKSAFTSIRNQHGHQMFPSVKACAGSHRLLLLLLFTLVTGPRRSLSLKLSDT